MELCGGCWLAGLWLWLWFSRFGTNEGRMSEVVRDRGWFGVDCEGREIREGRGFGCGCCADHDGGLELDK